MNLSEWLVSGFEYERWADRLWLEAYPQMPEPRHAEEILSHILWALETWLSRVNEEFAVEEGDRGRRLDRVCREWASTCSSKDAKQIISYQNTKGHPFRRQFGAIALHVLNHGTYHRGQMRGLAAEQGFEDFPETDLIRFFVESEPFDDPESG